MLRLIAVMLCCVVSFSAVQAKENVFPAPCRYQGIFGVATQHETSASGVLLSPSPMGPTYTHYVFAGKVGNTQARSMVTRLSHFGGVVSSVYYDDPASTNGNQNFISDIERNSNTLVTVGASAFNANSFGGYDIFAMLVSELGDVITSAVYGAATDFEYGDCARPTADGGYIFAGTARENTAQSYQQSTQFISVVKTDALLNPQWHRRYRVQLKGFVEDIIQLTDGSYVLTGATESNFAASSRDLLVMRLSSTGNVVWARRMGNPASGSDHGYAVRQSASQEIIVLGSGSSLGAGYGAEDLYLIHMNINGTVTSQMLAGWSGDDRGVGFEVGTNGVVRIGGQTRGPNANPGSLWKFWQMELLGNGQPFWSRLYAPPVGDSLNYDFDMLSQGSAWLTGVRGSGPGFGFEVFMIRTDPLGLVDSINGGCQVYQLPSQMVVSNPVNSISVTFTSLNGAKRPSIRANKYDLPGPVDCRDCTFCPIERSANRIGIPELATDYDTFRETHLSAGSGPALVEDYYLLAAAVNDVLERDDELTLALGEYMVAFSDSVVQANRGDEPVLVSDSLLQKGYALGRRLASQLNKEDAMNVESWIRAVEKDPVAFAKDLGIFIKLVP